MLRLTVNTKRAPADVLRKAHEQFGSAGLGLTVEEADGRTTFSGAGGYVTLAFETEDGTTVVDISSREFDDRVRSFARAIG